MDFETVAAVGSFTGLKIETALASEQDVLDAIDKHYGESAKQSFDAEVGAAQANEGCRCGICMIDSSRWP